jgi:hypothetical protein
VSLARLSPSGTEASKVISERRPSVWSRMLSMNSAGSGAGSHSTHPGAAGQSTKTASRTLSPAGESVPRTPASAGAFGTSGSSGSRRAQAWNLATFTGAR